MDWLHLRPTPNQYRAFSEYLCRAHSWYKHLPLIGGRAVMGLLHAQEAEKIRQALAALDE